MKKIEIYWEKFIEENPDYKGESYEAWHFCDNEKDAAELAELVLKGTKRGTASLKKVYDIEKEPLPKEGSISLITDFHNNPQCIIKTMKVHQMKFCKMTEELAAIEGEGDKSLQYWINAHKKAFGRDAAYYSFKFSEELEIIFEEFEVIYI